MGITAPALATFVGLVGAVLGIWMTGLRERARAVVPFSAGILLGVALFGLVPELASEIGWRVTVLLFSVGLRRAAGWSTGSSTRCVRRARTITTTMHVPRNCTGSRRR